MKQIQKLRGERSQNAIAKELKITKSYYSYIENGNRVPSLAIAIKIAKYYQVPVESLFCIEEDNIRLS